ncbi:hypothetical protein D4764_0225960 [Takifugu flavidus]|uniref:Uncharacterized protein n=1 Tax=Takifugu flavidus TaxID=433684 RepID=A0A5C6MG84_9TELE|nr:hypothetical protein D4764_0225960 [Takifugu flavidus]
MTSNPSHLRELSLSWNQKPDRCRRSKVTVFCNDASKLQTGDAQAVGCSLSEISCDSLALLVQSLPSEGLDLSGNQLKDPAVKLLCGFLQDPLCELETLRSVRDDPVLSQV